LKGTFLRKTFSRVSFSFIGLIVKRCLTHRLLLDLVNVHRIADNITLKS